MKSRHAAALTLVAVWIAIQPPIIWFKGHGVVYADAPISNWPRLPNGKFSSELACENWKAQVLSEQGFPSDSQQQQFEAIRCVPLRSVQSN